jgi:hypothetical protein|tara:strand:+ start:90 stop:620 length:531 start_codon:yes stop_codon:yes gene_type:complete
LRPQDQLSLFPELDPFKTIIKNIDYVDISTLVDPVPNHSRLLQYDLIPKDKFFLYKTGGVNPFRPELGNIFPYLKNEESKKLVSINISKSYVRAGVNVIVDGKYRCVDIKLHRVAALAFIVNDNPEKKVSVDHINSDRLDYSLKNLRWVTNSENNTGLSRPRNECWELTMIKKGKI